MYPSQEAPPAIPVDSLVGVWEGELITYEGRVPLRLTYEAGGDAWLSVIGDSGIDDQAVKFTGNPPRFRNGVFTARFPITVPTGDAARYEHWMYVRLWFAAGKLSGYALAEAQEYSYKLPSFLKFTRRQ